MSEKRFILCQDDLGNYEIRYDDKVFHFLWEVAPILNEQQSTIEQKDKQLQKAKEYFMDYLSREMSANNFSELWDLVIDDE